MDNFRKNHGLYMFFKDSTVFDPSKLVEHTRYIASSLVLDYTETLKRSHQKQLIANPKIDAAKNESKRKLDQSSTSLSKKSVVVSGSMAIASTSKAPMKNERSSSDGDAVRADRLSTNIRINVTKILGESIESRQTRSRMGMWSRSNGAN